MESLTPKVQKEAGDQGKWHRPGCQSVLVTCLHCLCGQQSLIYHCLGKFVLEITFSHIGRIGDFMPSGSL